MLYQFLYTVKIYFVAAVLALFSTGPLIPTPTPLSTPSPIRQVIVNPVAKPKVPVPTPTPIPATTQGISCKLDTNKYVTVNSQAECNARFVEYINVKYPFPTPPPKTYYPPCVIYYPALNRTEVYTAISPLDCAVAKSKISPAVIAPPVPVYQDPYNPLEDFTIVSNNPTPLPCSSLQGNVQISGGNCN